MLDLEFWVGGCSYQEIILLIICWVLCLLKKKYLYWYIVRMTVIWDMEECIPIDRYHHFGGMWWCHIRCRKVCKWDQHHHLKHSELFFFFFNLDYETIGTAATPGLLCQPRVITKMIVESMMEWRLAGETEVLGENLPQRHFCPSQNPTCPRGFEPGPPRWETGD
jgi:hypothetical protein